MLLIAKTWTQHYIGNLKETLKVGKIEKYRVPQSRESREIFGETETMKMAPRRDQSRGLESRLSTPPYLIYQKKRHCISIYTRKILTTTCQI